jgi:glyceraldehyde-3-phosphate dehydrogenase/erythrose-4-phosphate dehydrogenase
VGRIIRQLLEERDFPYRKIKFLASKRSAGTMITFKGEKHPVDELQPDAFKGVDLAIGSTPDEVAKEFCPWAVERDCVVVDESGYWRMDPKVPLVVPEVNPEALEDHQGIISSPNCSTTQMVVAMKPLHDAGRIRRVETVEHTLQRRGLDERRVAIEDQDRPAEAIKRFRRLLDGVGCTFLFGLVRGADRASVKRRLNLLAPLADHDHDLLRTK